MNQQRYRQSDERRRQNIETVWLADLPTHNSCRSINMNQQLIGLKRQTVRADRATLVHQQSKQDSLNSRKKQQFFMRLRGLVKLEMLANKKTTINQFRFIDALKRYAVYVYERQMKMNYATHSLVEILKQLKYRIDRRWKVKIMAILKQKSRRRYQLLCLFERIENNLQERQRLSIFEAFKAIKPIKRFFAQSFNIVSSMPTIVQCSSIDENPQLSDKSFSYSLVSSKYNESDDEKQPKTTQSTNEGDWQSVFSTPHKYQKQLEVWYGLRECKPIAISLSAAIEPRLTERPFRNTCKQAEVASHKLLPILIDKDVTNGVDLSHLTLQIDLPRPMLPSPSKYRNGEYLLYSPRVRQSMTTTTAEQYSLDGRSNGSQSKREFNKNTETKKKTKMNSTPAQLYDWLRNNGYERVARRQMERAKATGTSSRDLY